MAKTKFTDDELEQLTDEEREGLADDGDQGDEDEAAEAAAGDGAEAAAAAGGDSKADDNQPAPAAGDEPKPAEPVAPEPAPTPATAQPTAKAPAPQPQDETKPAAIETARTRLTEIDTQLADLAARFDEGDLTARELHEQQLALNNERVQLHVDIRIEENAAAQARRREESARDTWMESTVPDWLARHPQYAPGSPLYHALNGTVMQLQGESLAGGGSQYDAALLDEAHRQITAAVGGQPAPAPAGKREIPPTLAHVPAAEQTPTDDGNKFAALDRLNGEAYEEALAKLSDADRDLYLSR